MTVQKKQNQDIDVTEHVDRGNVVDDEAMEIHQCVCGHEYKSWHSIGIERDYAEPCPMCGRRLYFRLGVCIYEVKDTMEG